MIQHQRDRLDTLRLKLEHATASMELLSPLRTLERGYAIALRADGHIVRAASEAVPGESLTLRLGAGELGVKVESSSPATGAARPEVPDGARKKRNPGG